MFPTFSPLSSFLFLLYYIYIFWNGSLWLCLFSREHNKNCYLSRLSSHTSIQEHRIHLLLLIIYVVRRQCYDDGGRLGIGK